MNPMQLMQMKGMLDRFRRNHPRIEPFLMDAANRIDKGTVIEMKVTTSDGKSICANIRVNQEDMDLLNQVNKMTQN